MPKISEVTNTDDHSKLQLTPYHAKYFAYELTRRYSSDSLQKLAASLSDAQVDLNPHQVEAALFAFRSPLSKGAILADEVGLGKTIEAGIVISQKWAERKRKILIIVPSSLRKQWNQELADKFFLPSIILETKSFNQEIKSGNLNPFKRDSIVICSYHFARSKDVYIKQVEWDLIVIDEAHHLRNVYKNTNKIANAIKAAVAHAPKLLLTATPLQNTLMELYGLVSIIDDYTFGDLTSFKSRFARLTNNDNFDDLKERLKPICKRTLRRQVLEYVKYTNRIPITQEFYPTENEQLLYDLISDYLQRQNLYALPSSQRQLMTLILRKLLASSTYAISGTLEALSNKLDAVVVNQETMPVLEETVSQDFEIFDEMQDEWTEDEDETEEKKTYTAEEIKSIKEESRSLKEFHSLAKAIKKNSKGEVLLTALKAGFSEAEKRGGVKKAVIFTESTRTQKYLENILENTEYCGKIVLFNGSNTDPKSQKIYKQWIEKHQGTDRISGSKSADMRAALVDYFRDEGIIMIATEAGAEGINLQFCSLVVNYDLPWNPQRIEQRIGRCHRYGQKHDVVVVNFLNKKNAADLRVYQLLSEKFKLFEGVFGASDEVLGSIESGVDFEKRIAQIYQQCRTEEEIQTAFDTLQKEMEPQIDETINLTRQRLLENFDEEVHEKLRINLQESRDYLSKYENWLWQVTKYYLEPYADFAESGYSFTLRENPFSNEPIHPGPYRIGKNIEDANIYRIGHPLARRIIDKCKSLSPDSQEVVFDYSNTPKKISVLEPLVGKSGWLSLLNLTINSFESEDHILFCGIIDDGLELDIEQCQRLFSLNAAAICHSRENGNPEKCWIPDQVRNDIERIAYKQQAEILQNNAERNGGFFDTEMEKLEKWAEDKRRGLKAELKDFDDEITLLKKEARLALNLPEKLAIQKKIRDLDAKRNSAWKEYDEAAKVIEQQKDSLLDTVEERLKQAIEEKTIFTIKWRIK